MIQITQSPDTLLEIIKTAGEFLWTVSFQLTDDLVIDLLVQAQSRGVNVRVITLPVDSYSDPALRAHLAAKHQELKGITYCEWEVGDPSLTNSSQSGQQRAGGGDKWYSLHAKFIVSEKYALVSSKNLNRSVEWDAYYRSESAELIELLKHKFQQVHDLFCAPSESDPTIPGHLFDLLGQTLQDTIRKTSRLLVPEYPSDLIPQNVTLADGLYVTPFDAVARLLINQTIENATGFVWIAGETLTDADLATKITARKTNIPALDLRLIAGGLARDPARRVAMRETILQMKGLDIPIRFVEKWHAKMILTESVVLLGSPNLNQINLGIRGSRGVWKANTEVVFASFEANDIEQAKSEFQNAFQHGTDAIIEYNAKATKEVEALLRNLKVEALPNARKLLGKIQTALQLRRITEFNHILQFARKIQMQENAHKLSAKHVVSGVILWQLEKTSMTRENLARVVLEMVGTNTEFELSLAYLQDSLRFVKDESGTLSLDALSLFPQ